MKVALLDSTLREGEQSPNVSFTLDQKINIVKSLDAFGVEFIEIGHPAVSDDVKDAISVISALETRAEKVIHCRALRSDIDEAVSFGVPWVGIFFGTSDLSLKHKFGIDRITAKKQIIDAVTYAKDQGIKLRFSAEDATRTNIHFLIEVAQAVEKAGADRFSIADTVGMLTPEKTSILINFVSDAINIPIHIHCHNDLGLATANSIVALRAGAQVADVVINGLGERSGIASLAEVAAILKIHYNVDNNWDLSVLTNLSKELESNSGIPNRLNQPIVGKYAFTHKSGLHTRAVIKAPETYEGFPPELVKQKREILLDKFTGKAAVADRLAFLNIEYSKFELDRITTRIKSNSKSSSISDKELLNFFNQ
ncbi:MAG: 2-isopropylmalate synthase [Candidatus Marinimicrobia bacterium]|nr:2-isopropylmalate synthase [Candidatus Neomarinimicrobiota bacterium]